jgi:hypothetical protein
MQTTKRLVPAALCGTVLILMLTAWSSPVRSQEDAQHGENSSESRRLDLKWIDAELALIQANLEHLLEQNKRSPGSNSDVFAEELRLRAKLFDAWRGQLETEHPRFIPIDVQKAEGDLKLAQMRLAVDQKVRASVPRAVSDIQIKKRQLAVEAAQIWLEKVRDPSYEKLSKDERNQWRLIVLGKEMLELRIESRL